MKLKKASPEVYWAEGAVFSIGETEINFLKDQLAESPRGRVRINVHSSAQDKLHEMFIAIDRQSYVRPHQHKNKSESFHIVLGTVDVVIFDEQGGIQQIVSLGEQSKGRNFFYRLSIPLFHTLIIYSDVLVMQEVTNGPFVPSETIFANFSPEESDLAGVTDYQAQLMSQVSAFKELKT